MEKHIEKIEKIIKKEESFPIEILILSLFTIMFLPLLMIMFDISAETENVFFIIFKVYVPFLLLGAVWYLFDHFSKKRKLSTQKKLKEEIDYIESCNNGFLKLYKNPKNKEMLNKITPDSEFIKEVYLKISGERLFEKYEYNFVEKYLILLKNINHVNDINKIHEEKEQIILLEQQQKLRQKKLEKQKKEYSKVLNKEEGFLDKMKFFVKKIKKHI